MFDIFLKPGDVKVYTEENRGHPPEFWAKLVTDRIIGVSSLAEPHVRQQAEAFKEKINEEVYRAIISAIRSDRQTVAGVLRDNGFSALADHISDFRAN